MGPLRLDSRTLAAAAPDFGLGLVFLIAWLAPFRLGEHIVAQLMLVMLLEFIIIHSSVFLGSVMFGGAPRRQKVKGMLAVGGFYTLFVGGFSLAFHTLWPLASFWLQILNRMLGVLLGQAPAGEEKAFIQRSWGAGVLFYLAGAFATTLLPIPRFGLTPAVVAGQELIGSGLWVDQPQRVIAFGFFYFMATGISELYGHGWSANAARPAERAERGRPRRAA